MKFILLICVLGLAGCGGSKSSSPTESATNQVKLNAKVNFDCNNLETCDANAQFCLISEMPHGAKLTTECIDKADNFKGCDTAKLQAKDRFNTSNNCSSAIYCFENNSTTTVRCIAPAISLPRG